MPEDVTITATTAQTNGGRNLKRDVSSGLMWSGIGRVLQQAVQFGLSVVLARLLSPGDYGLIAMAMVFTGFAGMLADGGFNVALVQRQNLTENHLHTVFWMNLGASTLLAGITFFLAPWLALFYHAPALTLIFRVIALNFILGAVGSVPAALLQKRMQFKLIARNDTVAMFMSGLVGVVLALRGAGVWSLVAQSLSNCFLNSLFRCWTCRWLPRMRFSPLALRELFGFSGHLYGFNFINYWARNADNLLIGKFFGAAPLGDYSRAYGLMLLPITQINSVISQVVFPAFASIQNDKERVKRIYLRAIGIVTLIAFPMMMGLCVVAKPFVLTVYGAKWNEVTVLLQILALVGVMQSLVNSAGWIFISQGKTDIMFKLGTVYSIAAISSFFAGVTLGTVNSVAICYAIVNAVFIFPWLITAGGVIDMKLQELLAAVAAPFFISVIMAAVVAGTAHILPTVLPILQKLAILVTVGAGAYGALVYFCKLSAWQNLAQLIGDKFRSRRKNRVVLG